LVATPPAVFVVDDDSLLRAFVVKLLTFSGFKRVTSYESGRRFLDEAPLRDADCVILDINMPDPDGLAVQRELTRRGSRVSVIVLTAYADMPIAVKAIKAGALDFIIKPFSNEALISSVMRAISGTNDRNSNGQYSEDLTRRLETLTPRQKEVFDRVVRGVQNKAIAHEFGISERTVETHRSRVMEKMNAPTLAALVRMTF
jgi:two-component system, LuxR family, response regulator FixJ